MLNKPSNNDEEEEEEEEEAQPDHADIQGRKENRL